MSLTEIQIPTKTAFYNDMQSIANQIKKMQLRLTEVSEFIQTMATADFDTMGIPAGDIRTDFGNFRTSMDSIVTELATHETIVDKIRSMVIV